MAEAEKVMKSVECREGARILVSSTLYEGDGRKLKDHPKVLVRKEDGKRYVQRNFVYPFPAGLIADPVTGQPAKEMSPSELAHSIGEWLKEIETLKANSGKVVSRRKDGTTVSGTVPTAIIPSLASLLDKGFRLSIQGPVNAEMATEYVVVEPGGKSTKARAPKDIGPIG